MTNQKLYETIIKMTFEYALYDREDINNSLYIKIAKSISDITDFNEICFKSAIFGLTIPLNADFKKFGGEDYLIQCLFFIEQSYNFFQFDDKAITFEKFLDHIASHSKLKAMIGNDFKNAVCQIYLDNICNSKEICIKVSSFIINYCLDCELFKNCMTAMKATGIY